MRQLHRTAVSMAAAHVAFLWSAAAAAQNATETVIVTGQRAALESAQKIKQESDEIVDSIVAEDIGKLPDRSVTEVLQRVVGVAMDRTAARGDPVHYSVEGSGIVIRGLTYVAAQLNGRDTFSANGGRALGFEDIPPELMSAVDVYKNPSAEQLEGGIAGVVNLRTALPFDFSGFKASVRLGETYSALRKDYKPDISGLIANSWRTDLGRFGVLLDLAHSKSSSRTDMISFDPYYLRTKLTRSETVNGTTTNYYAPLDGTWQARDIGWRQQFYDRTRDGVYGALQWKQDNVESAVTYFRSKYRFAWNEYAVAAQTDPYTVTVSDDSVYVNGLMVKGVLTNPSSGGIEVENGTRYASRDSLTHDLAWNLKWRANDRWTFTSDLQLVKSKTSAFDSTVATGVLLPKETIDVTGALPKLAFDAADLAYLADPNNYYWATTMEHFDKGRANQKAWRGDARYQFQDDPHLQDLRFGLRFTDRDALTTNSNPSYNWASVTHAWQRGWNINDLAWVTKYNDPTFVNTFSNFLGGKATMPAMVFPAASVAFGWPASYTSLHQHYMDICTATYYDWMAGWANNGCDLNKTPQGTNWALATFDTDPSGRNDQQEKTLSGYSQLRFGFDELAYPVDGSVGLRVVHTKNHANGYTILNAAAPPSGAVGIGGPDLSSFAVAQSFDNSYTNALPSLNLRMKAGSDLQFRFAWAKAISRPPLDKMQAYTTMSMSAEVDNGTSPPTIKRWNLTGTASGNPLLKPVQSNQQDLTAEWYFSKSGALTAAAFNKDLKDIIVDQTFMKQIVDSSGTPYNFVLTGPVNGAKGYARGIELAYRQYFDKLPGWLAGFGVEANYTFVDSKMKRYNAVYSEYCTAGAGADNLNLFINGCDTDGRSFNDLPLPNLSRNTVNLALLYDHGPFSARIAYSWRQRYMYGVALNSDATGPNQTNGLDTNPNSATYGRNNLPIGLPLWADDYGQLDAGIHFKVDDHLTLSLEGQNLNNAMYRQLMQQHVGMIRHNYFTSGRRYAASVSYTF